MSLETVLPMWQMARGRFTEKIKNIRDDELPLQLDAMSIGELIYHTAEVEYIFAEWFFNQEAPTLKAKSAYTNINDLLVLLQSTDSFLQAAMHALPADKWQVKVNTRMGNNTPAEAISRLIYHTGIHAGQITTIEKLAK